MGRRFLLFSAAGQRFALELRQVAEVMEPRQTFPIPASPRYFVGLMDCHGTMTALLDLARFLGNAPPRKEPKILLLDPKLASLALLVDGVGSIIPEEALLAWHPEEEGILAARLETETGEAGVINLETLLSLLEETING